MLFRSKEVQFSTGVDYDNPEEWEYGTALDIDENGGLIVQLRDGETRVLRTGEITLRPVY